MDRRQFTLSLAAFAAAAAQQPAPAAERGRGKRIAVIGAGIQGASIAWHLAGRGAEVTVFEKRRPAMMATANSFAWLNAYSKRPRPYYELNLLGLQGWRRLSLELGPALAVQWGGSVEWVADGVAATKLAASIRNQQSWGYGSRLIDESELSRLLPTVVPGTVAGAAWSEFDATVHPVRATLALLAAATARGARVESGVAVTGFERDGNGRVTAVQTSQGRLPVDAVVLAGGTETGSLAALLGQPLPLVESRGVLAHATAQPDSLRRVVMAPGSTIKQNPDGSVATGESFSGTEATEATAALGRQLLEVASGYLPVLRGAKLEDVTLGYRVLPKDSFPAIGFASGCANAWIAVMHSGMTLSPLVGQLAVAEVIDGASVDLLETFRPARFG